MDRDYRREGRGGRRDDARPPKPRQDRDRTCSPPYRERRDERRRDRSPQRDSRGPSQRYDRDRDYTRGRDRNDRQQARTSPPPRGGLSARGAAHPPRQQGYDSRAPPRGQDPKVNTPATAIKMEVKMEDGLEDEDSEAEMRRVMGFKDFRTTKNTKVPGNDKNYGVNKTKKAEYRQYMNRVGGFNRPLSPSRL